MEIVFLGTGAAWSLPEHSCGCAICTKMTELGEYRARTSLLIRSSRTVLLDCGPDLGIQMRRNSMEKPDLVLLTHEHGDHYLGMDDLVAFRRSVPAKEWTPIPVYASEETWEAVEIRFGYLLEALIEKRIAVPGVPLPEANLRITPFKTDHGPNAKGSVGYVLEEGEGDESVKFVYTSDFLRVEEETELLLEPDVLVIQSHWFNEPTVNRPHLMSFQRALDFIRRWRPRSATYLVHFSDGDQVPGDPCNSFLKKYEPLSPVAEPVSGRPYPVPRCHEEWQAVVDRICTDFDVKGPVLVARDGLTVHLNRDPGRS
ncbi:MAG: MBL fold metallo-hydrolase [Desulfomonile tiedjei]|nr:MBL fold metallo-hydrolase [Desulfomonile tiedjei]